MSFLCSFLLLQFLWAADGLERCSRHFWIVGFFGDRNDVFAAAARPGVTAPRPHAGWPHNTSVAAPCTRDVRSSVHPMHIPFDSPLPPSTDTTTSHQMPSVEGSYEGTKEAGASKWHFKLLQRRFELSFLNALRGSRMGSDPSPGARR